jgi:hypothetical protein
MAADPTVEASLAIVKGLPAAGADLIELGVMFSDPMADGPVIQAAGLRAKAGGSSVRQTLAIVRAFREGDDATPIILMGYYNPIYIYGVDAFLKDAKDAGVDGLIVVDLPPEEDSELCLPALAAGMHFVRLAISLLRIDRRHYRDRLGERRRDSNRRRPFEKPYRSAGRRRVRHQNAGAGRRCRAGGRRRRRRIGNRTDNRR